MTAIVAGTAPWLRTISSTSRAGGKVLAQDEASSVVYGMPRVVTELRLVDEVHSLSDMAAAL
ncbi:MAG: hypothetical protein LOD90_11450, partial [Symbiobacteriaceae bacterium]